MEITAADVKASIIAHAIRLGKCPEVGMRVGCNIQMHTADVESPEQVRLDQATPISEIVPVEFTVTAEDIAAGRRLINEQRARYREPKETIVTFS